MKTIKEKKLEVALLKEKLERISGKKVAFEGKENILVPRDQIDNRDEKYKQKIYKLLQQKVYDGDLDLSNLPFELESLGKLEEVNGNLYLENTSIKSLDNLEKANRGLWLSNSSITDLGNLEHVRGSLDLVNTPITDLGNLKFVGGYLWLRNTPIKSLGNLEKVGGKIYISKNQEKKIKGLEKFNYKAR
jgi:hypothetical protein